MMPRTRLQARPLERGDSVTLTSDDDADIPATTVRNRGRLRKGGPTLRPGIRPTAKPKAQATQAKRKRDGDKESMPSLGADKRQKRATPVPISTGPASRTRARSRTAEPEGRDGNDNADSHAAIDALNAFSRPRGTSMAQKSRIQISLPTSRQFLFEQNRAGVVQDYEMPLGSSPPLERILLPEHEDDEMEMMNADNLHSNMAVAASRKRIKSKRLSSPVNLGQPLNTIREPPRPLNQDVPIPSVESSVEEDEQVDFDTIQVAGPEPVEQLGQQGEEQEQYEDQDEGQDQEDSEEDKELPPASSESLDFSPDPPPAIELSTVYEIPDQESQVLPGPGWVQVPEIINGLPVLVQVPKRINGLPGPSQIPKTINGLTAKRTKKGPTRVPKVSFLESATHNSSSSPSLRQFLGDRSSSPLQPPAPRPTSFTSQLSGGRLQPEQTLGSSPPERQLTEDPFFLHDDDLDDFINPSEEEGAKDDEPVAKPAKSNPRAIGTSTHDDDPFSDDPFADSDPPEPSSRDKRPTQNSRPGGSRVSGPNDSLMIHAPSTLEHKNTTTLPSDLIDKLHKLMGMTGWTELSKTWSTELLQPDPFESGATDTPAISFIGRQLFKYLVHLKSKFSDAPSAPDLDSQNDWLLANKDSLSKATSEINKIIEKICEDRLAVIGDSSRPSSNDLERRRALVRDMVLCVIPMLVQTLWDAFALGGTDKDIEGAICLPVEGEFTTTTLQYLFRTTGWLLRLDRIVMFEMSQRPYRHYLIDGLGEASRKAYPEKSKKKRLLLGKLLKKWKGQLKEAMGEMEKMAEKEREGIERIRREPLVKAWKRRVKVAEEEKKRRQWEEFCQSTQRIRGTLEGRVFFEEERFFEEEEEGLKPYEGGAYERWDEEDSHLLLGDMREIVGRGGRMTKQVYEDLAEALGKPLGEVMYEAAKLRMAARVIAREKGMEVEEWARER